MIFRFNTIPYFLSSSGGFPPFGNVIQCIKNLIEGLIQWNEVFEKILRSDHSIHLRCRPVKAKNKPLCNRVVTKVWVRSLNCRIPSISQPNYARKVDTHLFLSIKEPIIVRHTKLKYVSSLSSRSYLVLKGQCIARYYSQQNLKYNLL